MKQNQILLISLILALVILFVLVYIFHQPTSNFHYIGYKEDRIKYLKKEFDWEMRGYYAKYLEYPKTRKDFLKYMRSLDDIYLTPTIDASNIGYINDSNRRELIIYEYGPDMVDNQAHKLINVGDLNGFRLSKLTGVDVLILKYPYKQSYEEMCCMRFYIKRKEFRDSDLVSVLQDLGFSSIWEFDSLINANQPNLNEYYDIGNEGSIKMMLEYNIIPSNKAKMRVTSTNSDTLPKSLPFLKKFLSAYIKSLNLHEKYEIDLVMIPVSMVTKEEYLSKKDKYKDYRSRTFLDNVNEMIQNLDKDSVFEFY